MVNFYLFVIVPKDNFEIIREEWMPIRPREDLAEFHHILNSKCAKYSKLKKEIEYKGMQERVPSSYTY